MIVQHNLSAMNANRQLGITNSAQNKATEKLSSGYRINRAGDDAAGLAISEKMRAQIRGLNKASTNAQDGISLIQTAEGALNETHSILQRMNELATQAANDTNTTIDRKAVQLEINALVSEIDRIQETTMFNTQGLLSGNFTGKKLQIGSLKGQTMSLSIKTMNAKSLKVDTLRIATANMNGSSTTGVMTHKAASNAMKMIQSAINKVSEQRAKLGAVQNRLEHTISNLDVAAENTQAAESRIRDVDMAKEMVEYSKNNILAQAGQSMLAQANQSTQGVLSLLG